MIKKLFYNNFKKELAVYADSSWKDGTAAFSYTDTHSKTFYVSNLFNCDSSVSAECYGAYCAIIHGIKTATMYNYNTITVYTDLLKLESLNNDKKNKMYKKENIVNNILKHIELHLSLYNSDLNFKIIYINHKKEPHLRLVDLLAYRQLKGIVIDKYKKDVFKELSHWKIHYVTFETF